MAHKRSRVTAFGRASIDSFSPQQQQKAGENDENTIFAANVGGSMVVDYSRIFDEQCGLHKALRVDEQRKKRPRRLSEMQPSKDNAVLMELHVDMAGKTPGDKRRARQQRLAGQYAMSMNIPVAGSPDAVMDDDLLPGERRFLMWEWLVTERFGIEMYAFQRGFFDKISATLVMQLCGQDWHRASTRLPRQRGWESCKYQCFGCAPRRWGKTWMVASVMAAFALCMPGSIQAVFSTSMRASNVMCTTVLRILRDCGLEHHIVTRGLKVEQVLIRPIYGNPEDHAVLKFFPANEKISI